VIEKFYSRWSNWALAADSIYFVNRTDRVEDRSQEGEWAIFVKNLRSGETSQIARLPRPPTPRLPGFSVSPDGRFVLVTTAGPSEWDLMLVENFQ
jgi:hypothetical protein